MKKILALVLLAMTLSLVPLLSPSADAAGPVSCYDTTQRSTTYSSFGISLFRHESKGNWCRDNDNIVSMSARRNAIVKVGIGNGYNSSTWINTGYTPAKNTWQDHYGQAGMTITAPIVGTVGISRKHHFDYDYTKTSTGSSWSRTSSSWYL